MSNTSKSMADFNAADVAAAAGSKKKKMLIVGGAVAVVAVVAAVVAVVVATSKKKKTAETVEDTTDTQTEVSEGVKSRTISIHGEFGYLGANATTGVMRSNYAESSMKWDEMTYTSQPGFVAYRLTGTEKYLTRESDGSVVAKALTAGITSSQLWQVTAVGTNFKIMAKDTQYYLGGGSDGTVKAMATAALGWELFTFVL